MVFSCFKFKYRLNLCAQNKDIDVLFFTDVARMAALYVENFFVV